MVIVIYINKVFQNGGQNGKKIKAELLNKKKTRNRIKTFKFKC